MKNWSLAASAALLMLTAGCKTVLDYGHNPGGGGTPGQHPWGAQWKPTPPPPPPVAQVPPAPAPAAPVEVAPAPAPVAVPIAPPAPPPVPTKRVPRRERG
jgi:hypothetical protein